jgi:uncharacterized protein (DUF2062 family)
MHTRIAIVFLPGPNASDAPAGQDALEATLPMNCFILDEENTPGADTSTDGHQRVKTAPARLLGCHLRAAAHRAKAQAATHLIFMRHRPSAIMPGIHKLVAACQAHPEALIIGHRPPIRSAGWHQRWFGEKIPRFWLKIQTGRHLTDPLCTLRVYPVTVIENLRLYQRGTTLDTEILVKSAWADVPFQDVPVDRDIPVPGGTQPTLRESGWQFLLNIHYALRSVLPVPHRKLVSQDGEAGTKISVWRPMRSLRTLLRENTSPTQLALATAVGVFLGTLPLIACHTLVIILTATYFRLNKVAALASSQLCMPPVVPALCIETGYFLRHGRFLTEISLETLGYQALERLYEWLLGSLVLAPLLALLIGGMTLMMARLAARSMAAVRNLGSGAG